MKKVSQYQLDKIFGEFTDVWSNHRPIHTSLYSSILRLNNKRRWSRQIKFSTKDMMKFCGSKRYVSFRDALDDLAKIGAISIIQRSKNQYTEWVIKVELDHEILDQKLQSVFDNDVDIAFDNDVDKLHEIDKSAFDKTTKAKKITPYIYNLKHIKKYIKKDSQNFEKKSVKKNQNNWGVSEPRLSLTHSQEGLTKADKNETPLSLKNLKEKKIKKKLRQKESYQQKAYQDNLIAKEPNRGKYINPDLCDKLLDCWNEKRIIVHRKPMKAELRKLLTRAIADFGYEDVFKSISNYADILSDDNFFFSYKWDLKTFLKRGSGENLARFLPEGDIYENWKSEKNNPQKVKGMVVGVTHSLGGIEYKKFDSNR